MSLWAKPRLGAAKDRHVWRIVLLLFAFLPLYPGAKPAAAQATIVAEGPLRGTPVFLDDGGRIAVVGDTAVHVLENQGGEWKQHLLRLRCHYEECYTNRGPLIVDGDGHTLVANADYVSVYNWPFGSSSVQIGLNSFVRDSSGWMLEQVIDTTFVRPLDHSYRSGITALDQSGDQLAFAWDKEILFYRRVDARWRYTSSIHLAERVIDIAASDSLLAVLTTNTPIYSPPERELILFRLGDRWEEDRRFKTGEQFASIDLAGRDAIVGTSGRAYAFEYTDGAWHEGRELEPPWEDSGVGQHVALTDGLAVLSGSAPVVYVFQKMSDGWSKGTSISFPGSVGKADVSSSGIVALSYQPGEPDNILYYHPLPVNIATEPLPDRRVRSLNVYPNPAHGTARIGFSLPAPGIARIEIIDIYGRRIQVLNNGIYAGGDHVIEWHPKDLPAGQYFVRFNAGSRQEVAKVVVIQ